MSNNPIKFGVIQGLPTISKERAHRGNVIIDDILMYEVRGRPVFSIVKGITSTMIKVVDLICEPNIDGIHLFINNTKNPVTQNQLGPCRRIHKVTNVVID